MTVKQLTEQRLEFLSLKGGCTGLSESSLVKMSRWKTCHSSIVFWHVLGWYQCNVTRSGVYNISMGNWQTLNKFAWIKHQNMIKCLLHFGD